MKESVPAAFYGRCIDQGTIGFDLPFSAYVEAVAAAGFDHVEVPVGALRELGPSAVVAITSRHALRPAQFSCPWDLPVNGSVPPDIFAMRLAALPGILDDIAAAGGRRVSAFFNGKRPGMVRLSHAELVERCAALAALAGERGLIFCVELNETHALADADRILKDAGTPALRLLFDTFHFFRAELSTDWIRRLPEKAIGWVHLSDVPHGAVPSEEVEPRAWPGAGCQDLGSILAAVAGGGYSGPLSVEILPAPASSRDRSHYAAMLLEHSMAALAARGITWAGTDAAPPLSAG